VISIINKIPNHQGRSSAPLKNVALLALTVFVKSLNETIVSHMDSLFITLTCYICACVLVCMFSPLQITIQKRIIIMPGH